MPKESNIAPPLDDDASRCIFVASGRVRWRCGRVDGHEGSHRPQSPIDAPWRSSWWPTGMCSLLAQFPDRCGCCGEMIDYVCWGCGAGLSNIVSCECCCDPEDVPQKRTSVKAAGDALKG